METFHDKLEKAYDYLREQMAESSTVRGIVTLLALAGGFWAKFPPDVTVTIGLVLSQVLKIMLPDDLPTWLHLPKWNRK